MTINLSTYTEFIETECTPSKTLSIEAIKLGGQPAGLKDKLGCGGLKSCDYLKDEDDCLILLEISDLSKQKQKQNLSAGGYQQLPVKLKEKFNQKRLIQSELRAKYTDTLTTLYELSKQTQTLNIDKNKIYLVAICSNTKPAVIIFQAMLNNIKANLGTLVKKVVILPVAELEAKLNNQLCQD